MSASQYDFGPFRLDLNERQLLYGNQPVKLQPKSFSLLTYFVQNSGRLLKRSELMDVVWPDVHVNEGTLTHHVSVLREKLREYSPSEEYIETAPKGGYRFIAKVNPINAPNEAEDEEPPEYGAAPYQLAAPVADFVGREQEIELLGAALRGKDRAVVTGINGMGGTGKTQLALVVANQLREVYPDAQLFLDLRGAGAAPRSPEDALAECIRTFVEPGVKLPGSVEALGKLYRSVLSGRRALIMLDNAAGEDQVLPLLPPQGCALLVTSRPALSIPGMVSRTLEQLTPGEARLMLMNIAPRRKIPFDIADQICAACGYLPLAVRTAATLLDITIDLEAEVYARQLRDERRRLELLKLPGINLDVEASLSLSYVRLAPEAASVFRRLAVFPSTFDGKAEEVICGDENRTYLTSLLRYSLVLYDGTAKRYHLHDLLRLIAKKYLGPDEFRDISERHSSYYLDVLRAANQLYMQGGAFIGESLALFGYEWSNIQAGQVWASERSGEDMRASELCNDYPSAGADILSFKLHPREQILWREAAAAAARRLDNAEDEGRHLGYMGEAYRALGDLDNAMRYHQEHLKLARRIGDRRGERLALGGIGLVYENLGDFRLTLDYQKQALEIARGLGDRLAESKALGNIGVVYTRLGDLPRAIECHELHLIISRELGDRLGEAKALGNLGLVYHQLGEYARAIEFNEQALDIFREIGGRRNEGDALGNIGSAYAALGEIQRALEYFEQELVIAREMADRELQAEALNYLGVAHAKQGHEPDAVKAFSQALAISREVGTRRIEGNTLWNMSLFYESLGEIKQAIIHAECALEIYRQIEDPSAGEVHKRLAKWRGLPE